MPRRRLLATPLAAWERDGLKAALLKVRLPADDVGDARLLFWRFETVEDIPVGFGGLEIHGSDALLRSLVTLPPLRQIGMGAAMVATLETEARAQLSRDLPPDRLGREVLRPARLWALRAQRRAGSDPRQSTICRTLRADRGRNGQAYRLARRRQHP
jgi:GNAT superfamily N-acetyltransferase